TNTGHHYPPLVSGVMEPSISAIVMLDSEGNRLGAKYYTKDVSLSDLKSQLNFERKVFEKTNKNNARQDGKQRSTHLITAHVQCASAIVLWSHTIPYDTI